MKTCLISCSCAGANVDLSRDESRWSQWMCCSEETGETGCPTIFLIFKSPRIYFFFFNVTVFADVYTIFKFQDFFVLLYIMVIYFPCLWETFALQQDELGLPSRRLLL